MDGQRLKLLVESGVWTVEEIWVEMSCRSMELGLEQSDLGKDFWTKKFGEDGPQQQLFNEFFGEGICHFLFFWLCLRF